MLDDAAVLVERERGDRAQLPHAQRIEIQGAARDVVHHEELAHEARVDLRRIEGAPVGADEEAELIACGQRQPGGRLALGTGEGGRELLEHLRILGFYEDLSGDFKSDPACAEQVLLFGDSVSHHLNPHPIRLSRTLARSAVSG